MSGHVASGRSGAVSAALETEWPNDIDVIVTGARERDRMFVEHAYDSQRAAREADACDMSSPGTVHAVVGGLPFRTMAHAMCGLAAGGRLAVVPGQLFEDVFKIVEHLAMEIARCDVPPLPCRVMEPRFRMFIEEYLDLAGASHSLVGRTVMALLDEAFVWLDDCRRSNGGWPAGCGL